MSYKVPKDARPGVKVQISTFIEPAQDAFLQRLKKDWEYDSMGQVVRRIIREFEAQHKVSPRAK